MTTRIVILTGDEPRHRYVRLKIAQHANITVLASFCEGTEASLENRTHQNTQASTLERVHVAARAQSEQDFFGDAIAAMADLSNPVQIAKGAINNADVVAQITEMNPDLLVCYGSSLIKSALLDRFQGKFLNVHLGLSPYYRGSGTNVWPLINGEPDMVGATFMQIDAGIDTGAILHQIRADIVLGDSPHSIGNRLIRKMAATYADLIASFNDLQQMPQPDAKGRLYLQKDFDADACAALYQQFRDGLVENHLTRDTPLPYIVENQTLKVHS